MLAHAVATAESELPLLAGAGTSVAFCPSTSLKLAKGATAIGRYPEMREAGIDVGLGTDGVSAAGNLNLMRQLYLTAGLFKDARLDAEALMAADAFRMATIEGARALGWDDEIGSLEVGKQADFVLFDLNHPEWVPCGDPLQTLVWSASSASIAETWVAGRRVYANGAVAGVDEVELRAEAQAACGRPGQARRAERGRCAGDDDALRLIKASGRRPTRSARSARGSRPTGWLRP